MSLADTIRQQTAAATKRCKTCDVLAVMTPQDRADFEDLRSQIPGRTLARAVTARLKELGIEDSVGESSVRTHISKSHP